MHKDCKPWKYQPETFSGSPDMLDSVLDFLNDPKMHKGHFIIFPWQMCIPTLFQTSHIFIQQTVYLTGKAR